jgi:hypothetical protein
MGNTTIFQITKWQDRFENNDSRKITNARWVPVPNKHDGLGFRHIAAHERNCEIFAAWTLILQVASRMPTRGILHNGEFPLDAEDLAVMTGFPQGAFEIAFEVLSQPKIGWIEVATERHDSPENAPDSEMESPAQPDAETDITGDHPDSPGSSPGTPGSHPDSSRHTGTEGKGIEGNRTEGKGSEVGDTGGASPPRNRFTPPSPTEAANYFADRGLDPVDAQLQASAFIDHYESNGWMVGRVKMKDWRSTIRNWIRNTDKFKGSQNGSTRNEVKPVRGKGF